MAVVLAQGADVPAFQDRAPVIGSVLKGSPAESAGLKVGDRILSLADRDVETWEQFFMTVGTKANRDIPIVIVRNGQAQTLRVTPQPQTRYEFGDIGVLPDIHPLVASVNPGEPAEKAGLKPNDVVVAVDGTPIVTPRQLSEAIGGKAGVPITIAIEREGKRQDVTVTPEKRGDIGMIGIRIGEETKRIQPTPLEAVKMSFQKNWEFGGLIFQTLWGLVTRETSPRQLMGPVEIARLSGESAQAVDRTIDADGLDQLEPRPAQPHAVPRARRRPHLHHGARRPRAPRLQHASERKDVSRGLRPADDVDGDGHLQRPHPRRLDQQTDDLAKLVQVAHIPSVQSPHQLRFCQRFHAEVVGAPLQHPSGLRT
jgi:membrane-associated protease RseP (regulator of RpoE activity)